MRYEVLITSPLESSESAFSSPRGMDGNITDSQLRERQLERWDK